MESKPVRIAHVIGKLNAAGVEAVVNNYYKNIDHDEYQFDFYIDADSNCEPPQELINMGARYFVIPPYQKLPQHIRTLISYFRENQYKVVHSGMNTLAPFSLYAAWIAGVPIRINHNHSIVSGGETRRNILKYMLRPFAKVFATDYCACSTYAGEWLFGKRSMKKGEVTVFNNAVDLNKFKRDAKIRDEIRQELGIEDKIVIGHIGRFCFQKNHDFLVDIFEEIHKRNPNSVLMLVGIGELTDEIKQKVQTKGLDSNVLFLGHRTDCDRLYQAMDVFVLPSYYEGLPVVGVEAQASGVPCVFSASITDETKMTKNAIMLNLNEGAEKWAEIVLEQTTVGLMDSTEDVRKAGFDISVEAGKLEKFYTDRIKQYDR